MADIFGDNPPQDYTRGNKGWLKPKSNSAKKRLSKLNAENADLKLRLEQLEAAVAEMTSGSKKKK